jgi:peptidoglycan/xylan/chitin deacetylase (PgdA/CDA1 family)
MIASLVRRARRVAADRLGWVAVPAGWCLRLSGRPLGLALGYHAVGEPEGDSRRELVAKLSPRTFESQLRHLRRHYVPVPASELRKAVEARRRGQRIPVAVTFDDDLGSHAQVAMPILRRSGVPATFFVCGASLDGPFAFWWERLQRAFDAGLLTGAERERLTGDANALIHRVASAIQQLEPEERDDVSRRLGDLTGPDPPDAGLRREQLRLLADAEFEIGFHTRRHDDMRRLDDARLGAAVSDGRSALESVARRSVDLIAYPHGSADERVASAARANGYTAGFTMDPEAVAPEADPLLMGRIEPGPGPTSRFGLELVRALYRGRRERQSA